MKSRIFKLCCMIYIFMTSFCFVHADSVDIILDKDGEFIFLNDNSEEIRREQQIKTIIIALVIVLIVSISFMVLKYLSKKKNENKSNDQKIEDKR